MCPANVVKIIVMNSLFTIMPYKWMGMWVFDDPIKGLDREAFVAGADTVIDMATAHIPNAEDGFILIFADFKFPGSQICLTKKKSKNGTGTDYFCKELGIEAWLCPALNLYYEVSPKEIHAEFRPIVGRGKARKEHVTA